MDELKGLSRQENAGELESLFLHDRDDDSKRPATVHASFGGFTMKRRPIDKSIGESEDVA